MKFFRFIKKEREHNMSIETVLFDLDGTLIDSNELIHLSFEYTMKHYGFTFTDEELRAFNGPPLWDTFSKLNPGHEDAMIHTYREHNFLIHDEYVKIFPYVIPTIEKLKKKGIGIGIVTSKMRKGVTHGLTFTTLDKYVDTIVTVDDVVNAKPHPESVLKAMNSLNGKKNATLMVGDNSHDILAGQRAGVYTAGVTWTEKGQDYLASYKPTYMLKDMRELIKIVEVS